MRSIALILSFIYMVFMLTPAVPFLEYAIDYETIVAEKCVNKFNPEMECNGMCHLKKQVESQEPVSKPKEMPGSFAYYDFLQCAFDEEIELDFSLSQSVRILFDRDFDLLAGIELAHWHPPSY